MKRIRGTDCIGLAAVIGLLTAMAAAAQSDSKPSGSTGSEPSADACSSLSSMSEKGIAITLAATVPAGEFEPPAGREAPASRSSAGRKIEGLPAFCRVTATLKPTPSSDIKVEIWMPGKGLWNKKFLGTGTGGLGGSISYPALADGLRRGYAVANSDLGTSGGVDSMVGKMERVVDYGNRSTHLMTVLAKNAIERFYAAAPTLSYFRGCSTGGGQGFHEAQQYPDDYDAILAGAPGAGRVPAHLAYLWAYAATQADEKSYLPEDKKKLWADKVMASCDALDGLKDGLIVRPDKCTIDPAVMQCKEGDHPDCLTSGQVAAIRKIYAGPRHSVTGEQLSPGYLHGSEPSFLSAKPDTDAKLGPAWPFQWVWGMSWDWRSFNWGADVDAMRNTLNFAVDATDPDIKAFAAHHGKILVYQGLADNIQVPGAAAAYVQRVHDAMPGEADHVIKLFNVPGMGHCGRGYGPNVFGNQTDMTTSPSAPMDADHDIMVALEQWVEKGREPTQIVATKFVGNDPSGKVERTMPLCAWPKVSKYVGKGNPNDAASFRCVNPDL